MCAVISREQGDRNDDRNGDAQEQQQKWAHGGPRKSGVGWDGQG